MKNETQTKEVQTQKETKTSLLQQFINACETQSIVYEEKMTQRKTQSVKLNNKLVNDLFGVLNVKPTERAYYDEQLKSFLSSVCSDVIVSMLQQTNKEE